MLKFIFLIKYLRYRIFAKHRKGFGIHSPFLFEFIQNVLCMKTNFYAFEEIEELRNELLDSDEIINVNDLGAGSKNLRTNERRIRDIIKYSAVKPKFGILLFKLVLYTKSKTIIELGTSLGIGTSYLAKPDSGNEIYTIEGCDQTASKALRNFKTLKLHNIKCIIGNIDEKLPEVLSLINRADLIYFDGNHKKEANIKYFNLCLLKKHNDSVFYFDDIHWSREMEDLWEEIKKHREVTLTIDLFFGGIVLFKKELSKQNFILKF